MMYVRGSTQDYDNWAELVEDDGWSGEHMQGYMRKHEVGSHLSNFQSGSFTVEN